MLAIRQFHQHPACRKIGKPDSVFTGFRNVQPGHCPRLLVPLRPRTQQMLERCVNISVKASSADASDSSAWTGLFEAIDNAVRNHKGELIQRKVHLLPQEEMATAKYRDVVVRILRNRGCTPTSAVGELSNSSFLAELLAEAQSRYQLLAKDESPLLEPSTSTARGQDNPSKEALRAVLRDTKLKLALSTILRSSNFAHQMKNVKFLAKLIDDPVHWPQAQKALTELESEMPPALAAALFGPTARSSSEAAVAEARQEAPTGPNVNNRNVNSESSKAGAKGGGQQDTRTQKGDPQQKHLNLIGLVLDMMQKEPAMHAQMYPYLPEAMQNTETITHMLSDEACRSKLEEILIAQVDAMSPEELAVVERAQSFYDLELMRSVSSDPELVEAFQKPSIQQAIMDIESNPKNIEKYYTDADFMKVLEKLSQVTPNASG